MPLHSRFAAVGLALFVMINVRGQADTLSFSLIPADGNISGPAGSTIGWGYSITNDSMTNWLVTAALTSDTFAFGTPNAIFDFPNVAPGATITLAYAQSSGSGLFELTWDSSAPVGFENFGRFILSSQWWNGDPLGGGTYLSNASDVTAAYSALVNSSPTTVPEPLNRSLLLVSFLFSVRHATFAVALSQDCEFE